MPGGGGGVKNSNFEMTKFVDEPFPFFSLGHQRICMNSERRVGAVKLKPFSLPMTIYLLQVKSSRTFSSGMFFYDFYKHVRFEDDNAQVCICKY